MVVTLARVVNGKGTVSIDEPCADRSHDVSFSGLHPTGARPRFESPWPSLTACGVDIACSYSDEVEARFGEVLSGVSLRLLLRSRR